MWSACVTFTWYRASMGFGRAAPRREVPRPSSPQAPKGRRGAFKRGHGTSENGNQWKSDPDENGCKIWCLVWRRIKLQEYFQKDRKVGHLEKYGKNIYGKHIIYTMLENSFSIFFWDCDIYVSNLQLTKPLTSTCGGCFIVIILSVFQTTSFRPSKTARSRATSSV